MTFGEGVSLVKYDADGSRDYERSVIVPQLVTAKTDKDAQDELKWA